MSNRNILILMGSPRKDGNTAALAEQLTQGAQVGGAEVRTLYLHGMDINPCTACEACHTEESKGCIIEDEMMEVYDGLQEADSIVFASPVYWFSVTAQIKTVIDRIYAVGVGDGNILKGKRLGILMPYADADPFISGAVNALRMFQDISDYLGTKIAGMVYGTAHEAGEIRKDKSLMNKAFQLGKELSGF
jgi:multimeric flavodoxin WrbA